MRKAQEKKYIEIISDEEALSEAITNFDFVGTLTVLKDRFGLPVTATIDDVLRNWQELPFNQWKTYFGLLSTSPEKALYAMIERARKVELGLSENATLEEVIARKEALHRNKNPELYIKIAPDNSPRDQQGTVVPFPSTK